MKGQGARSRRILWILFSVFGKTAGEFPAGGMV